MLRPTTRAVPATRVKGLQLLESVLGDRARAVGRAVEHFVVHEDGVAVGRQPQVETRRRRHPLPAGTSERGQVFLRGALEGSPRWATVSGRPSASRGEPRGCAGVHGRGGVVDGEHGDEGDGGDRSRRRVRRTGVSFDDSRRAALRHGGLLRRSLLFRILAVPSTLAPPLPFVTVFVVAISAAFSAIAVAMPEKTTPWNGGTAPIQFKGAPPRPDGKKIARCRSKLYYDPPPSRGSTVNSSTRPTRQPSSPPASAGKHTAVEPPPRAKSQERRPGRACRGVAARDEDPPPTQLRATRALAQAYGE